ncbi:MAG: hypothetical protein JWQ35_214 [Bacteriovoracaceae bacterium]|nr:hypothetical protein [Bacteriovoracaceae bacterium]
MRNSKYFLVIFLTSIASILEMSKAIAEDGVPENYCLHEILSLFPNQADINRAEVETKMKKIRFIMDHGKKWREFLVEHAVPIAEWSSSTESEKRNYFYDHTHETMAIYKIGLENLNDPRFTHVYGYVGIKVHKTSEKQRRQALYESGKIYPFRDGDRFLDREGRFIPFEKIPETWWDRIPHNVKGLGNSEDRGFGAMLRDALELPHHIVLLEFRLAEIAKVRWGVTEEEIVKNPEEAVKKILHTAKDDPIVSKLMNDPIEFQK